MGLFSVFHILGYTCIRDWNREERGASAFWRGGMNLRKFKNEIL